MTIKEIQEILKPYRKELATLVSKSDESFEKQLSYISSGALGLSFLLVEKVIVDIATSDGKWILVFGWACLTASLLVNLLSHRVASKCYGQTIVEIDSTFKLSENHEGDYPNNCFDSSRAEERRKTVRLYNSWSIWLLFSGIVLIISYSAINLFDSKKSDSKDKEITLINNIYNSSSMLETDTNKARPKPLNEGRQGTPAPIISPAQPKRRLEGTPPPKIPTKPKTKKRLVFTNIINSIMAEQDNFPKQDNQGGDWKKGLEGGPTPQIIYPERDDLTGREGVPTPQIIPEKKPND